MLISGYVERFKGQLDDFFGSDANIKAMELAMNILVSAHKAGKNVFIVGNGGSSAVAEHAAIDFTKNAGLRAMSFSGTPLLTTFSNDYGYENVYRKCVEHFANEEDVLIAISSSGSSKNIVNACVQARLQGLKVVTLSGFKSDNPLRACGDVNMWVDTEAFGFLEIIHGMILHYINDSIIGDEIYMIR